MRKLLSLLVLFLFSGAFAQDFVVNPQGPIVNPSPPCGVDVWLNKRGAEPVYQPGENITISASPTADAYIYLFNVRSDGEVVQILPNQYDAAGRDNFVRAGQTKVFPPQGGGYNFEVTQPFGLDKVIAVASRDQLNTSTLASFRSGEDFATSNLGESGFARALGIIVTPVPSTNWVTDTAHFWVGSPPARPTTGTINISSSPSGASAFVNDSYVGTTPISYTTQAGQYTIRVELPGYERHSGTINLSGGQSVNVNANLVPSRQTGTVRFRSTPNGASVWVNNQNLGTTPLNNIVLDVGSYEARFELAGYSSTV